MAVPLLALVDLTKWFRSNWTFRRIPALDRVSLAIEAGEVFGLIGHNGAGKTTTFKLLAGLLRPSAGEIRLDGRPLRWQDPRQGIGFSPEQPYFYEYLTVRETLTLYARLYGMTAADRRQRIAAVTAQLRIERKLDARMRTLSKGTLQRVAVAQAILPRPRVVILDEPMSGLDPSGRKEMRDLILSTKADGTTVLFSSHILSDAELLCDRVAVLASGRLRDVVDLRAPTTEPTGYTLVLRDVPAPVLEALGRVAGAPPVGAAAGGPGRWSVVLPDRGAVLAALTALNGSTEAIEALVPQRPSLEQRFLRSVGAGDEDPDP